MPVSNGDGMTRAFRAAPGFVARAMQENRKPAILGWQKSATEIVLDAPGNLGELYIEWQGTHDKARRRANFPLARRLPVLIERIAEVNYIVDIDWSDPRAVMAVLNNSFGVFPHPLSSHQDVLLTTLSNDEVLAWDATAGKWVNVAQAGALVTSVNGQAGAVVLDADHIDDSATTNKFATAAELTKLAGIEALADVTDAGSVGGSIHGAAEKTTIHDDDEFAGIDTEAADALTWWKWSTIRATLQATFLTFTQKIAIAATATTGAALRVVRDLAAASTDSPVVDVVQDNAGDDQVVLRVQQDGTGDILLLVDGATTVLRVLDGGAVIIGTGAVAGVANLYLTQVGAALMRINADTSDNPEIRLMLDASTKIAMGYLRADDTFRLGRGTSLGAATDFVIDASGNVGIGVVAPQGKLHIHDSVAGHLIVTKTNVNATAQIIIPNAAGDVTAACLITALVLSSAGGILVDTFTLVQGGTMTRAYTIGTSTWTVTLNANGQLSVARTSATAATATIKFTIDWI